MIKLVGQVFNVNFTVSYKYVLTFVQKLCSLISCRYYFYVLSFSLLSLSTVGQHYVHSSVWLRFAPTWDINKRWSLTADLWYRRQNDLHGSKFNPLATPLLAPSGRIGINYRTKHWSVALFPVALYRAYPTLGKEADYSRPRTSELRPTVLIEWSQALAHHLSIRIRGGYEYRRFAGIAPTGRARFRVLLRRDFSSKMYTSLWNETLLPVAPNIAVHQLYEINRTNLAIGQRVNKYLILEAGYQFSHRQRRTLTEFDEEHALTVTGFYRF